MHKLASYIPNTTKSHHSYISHNALKNSTELAKDKSQIINIININNNYNIDHFSFNSLLEPHLFSIGANTPQYKQTFTNFNANSLTCRNKDSLRNYEGRITESHNSENDRFRSNYSNKLKATKFVPKSSAGQPNLVDILKQCKKENRVKEKFVKVSK